MTPQSLWTVDTEKDMLTDTMFSTIHCDGRKGGCGNTIKSVFRARSNRCLVCGEKALTVSSFNQRNALVADITERFAHKIFSQAISNSSILSGNYFVKRNVVCKKLGLQQKTSADLAILNVDTDSPVSPEMIECIMEIKMSIIWNWTEGDELIPIADYDSHAGRPSIYRTDSIKKAIGEAAIIRSYSGSEKIPYIVLGNTPPPPAYRERVDGTVKSGLIQKWLSLTPKPLIVEPTRSKSKRNPKNTSGFLRIDSINELQDLLVTILTRNWQYMGAMIDATKLGTLIKNLDLSKSPAEIGKEFLVGLPSASSLSLL